MDFCGADKQLFLQILQIWHKPPLGLDSDLKDRMKTLQMKYFLYLSHIGFYSHRTGSQSRPDFFHTIREVGYLTQAWRDLTGRVGFRKIV